jgi:hypothetical protein
MARNIGIIAYGDKDDRARLAAIVSVTDARSGSEWIITQVREKYVELFGDMPPQELAK